MEGLLHNICQLCNLAYKINIQIYFDLTLNIDGFDNEKRKFFVKKISNFIMNNRIYIYDAIDDDDLLINGFRNTLSNNNVNKYEFDNYLNEFRNLLYNN
jgi:hypothetical protein